MQSQRVQETFGSGSKRFAVVIVAGLLWSLCLTYSLTSALGFAAMNRDHIIGARVATRANYEAAVTRLADLEKTRSRYRNPPRQLDDRIDRVRQEVAELRAKGAAGEADPQSKLISQATFGLLAKDQVRLALVALFAVMVEIGAALGLFAALAHLPRRAPEKFLPAVHSATEPKSIGRWLPPAQRKKVAASS